MAQQIKQILHDILDVAFCNSSSEKIREYKTFSLVCGEAEVASYGGYYTLAKRKIRICGTAVRDSYDLITTAIHELAHHINECDEIKVGHGKDFYAVYKKLIFAALNMGIISCNDLLVRQKETTFCDKNKVVRMLDDYVPQATSYKAGRTKIHVYNARKYKELFTARGYNFSSIDGSWYRDFPRDMLKNELIFLFSFLENDDVHIADARKLYVKRKR